jgi:heme exporter protein B
VAALVRAELRLEARTGDVLRGVAPYAVAALVVLALSVDADTALLRQIGLGAGGAVLLLFGSQSAARRGLLDADAVRALCAVSGVAAGTVLLARVVTTLAMLLALAVVVVPVTVVLFDLAPAGGWWLAAAAVLALVGLATLTALAATLVATTSVRAVVAPLLVVPLSVPLLLAVVQIPATVTYGGTPLSWLLLAGLVDLVLVTSAVALAPWLEGAR